MHYFFVENDIVKILIEELNPQFNWDMVNYNEFYFKNNQLVFKSYYQTLVHGQFELESKYESQFLLNLSSDLIKIIKNNNKTISFL